MKPTKPMKIRKSSLKSFQQLLPVVVVTFTIAGPAQAQTTLYWDGGAGTNLYATPNNWDTAEGGGGGNPGAIPGSLDTAVFNTSALNGPVTIRIEGNSNAASGIIINNTGTTNFQGSILGGRTFSLGAGGLTINSGAGVLDFVTGSFGINNPWKFSLTASQIWTNDSSNTVVYDNANSDGIALGTHVLTFSGSQGFTINENIISGVGGGFIVDMDAADDLVTFGNTNTYTGTTTIKAGTLFANSAGALGNGGNITFTGGTLRYSAASAADDYGSRIQDSTAAIAVDTNGNNATLGVIDNTNSGGLTKSGAGALSLTGANTYTGTTTIDLGRVDLTSSNASAITVNAAGGLGGEGSTTGAVTFSGGDIYVDATTNGTNADSFTAGNLDISGGVNVVFDVAPSGPGAFDVLSYTGTLTTDGTLGGNVSTNFTFGVPVSGRGGIVLDDNINKVITADLGYLTNAWTGSASGVWNQNSTANWSNSNDSVFWGGDFVTFGDSATNKTVSIDGANVAPTTVTFNNTTGNDYTVGSAAGETLSVTGGISVTSSGNVTIDSVIEGIGVLSHTGSGTVTLNNANTFTGGVSVGSGAILSVTNSDALGSTGAIGLGSGVNAADAELTSTAALSLGSRLDLTGDATIDTSAALNLDGLTVSGTTVVFTKEGAGTTTIGGDNSTSAANLSKVVSNDGGQLKLENANALADAGIEINDGGSIRLQPGGYNNAFDFEDLDNNTVYWNDQGTVTFGAVSSLNVGAAGQTLTFNAENDPNKNLALAGTVTGAGNMVLPRGVTNINSTADLSGFTGTIVLDNSGAGSTTLHINPGRTLSNTVVAEEDIDSRAKTIGVNGTNGSATYTDISLKENTDGDFNINAESGETITVSGSITDDGDGTGVDIIGAGTVIFSGTNNTYGSGTRVEAGCLIITNAAAIPESGGGTTVSADAGFGFGFDPTGLSDAEIETIVNNVSWDSASQLVFSVDSGTQVVAADLSGFDGDTIVLKGTGTLDLSGATGLAGVTFSSPDGTIIQPPAATPITVDSITTGPGSVSGIKVTLAFTASGNVDAWASGTLEAGSWSLVAEDISSSPAVVEDNVGSTKRFYVLVPADSGNPYP